MFDVGTRDHRLTLYFFAKLLCNLAYMTTIFVGLVWAIHAIRFFDLITDRHILITQFFQLTSLLLPDLVALILPFAFCLSTAYVYAHNRKELSAAQTLGIATFRLAHPVIGIAILCVGIEIVCQTVSPHAFSAFTHHESLLRNQITLKILKPKHFNMVGQYTIFYENKTPEGVEKVFVAHKQNNQNVFVTAQKGWIEKGCILHLEQGMRVAQDPSKGTFLRVAFQTLDYTLDPVFEGFHPIHKAIFGAEWLQLLKKKDKPARAEAYLRLLKTLLPLLSLLPLIMLIFYKKRFFLAAAASCIINGGWIVMVKSLF